MKKEGSVLYENSKKYHERQSFSIKVSILARCFGEPMTRLITEAVLINGLSDEETVNSREEWSYIRLQQSIITRQ